MNDLTQAPSNVSSVSVRVEDGLIIEEVVKEVTIDTHVQQQQQQEMATSTYSNHNKTTPNNVINSKQMKNKKFFSFFNNHQNRKPTSTNTSTTTSPLKSTSTSTKTNNNNTTSSEAVTEDDELTIVDLPSPEDIVGNNHNRNSLDYDGKGNNFFFGVGGGTQPQKPGMHAQCKRSYYGHPISIPEIKEYFDLKEKGEDGTNVLNGHTEKEEVEEKDDGSDLWEEGGLVWYSHIVPDDFDAQFTTKGTLKMLPKKFYDETTHSIKPRRGTLSVRESDFFTSLVKINTRKDKKNIDGNTGGGVEVSVRHDGDEYDEGYADDDSDFKIFDTKLKIFDDYSSVGDGIVGDTTEVYVQNKAMKQQYSKWFFSGVLNGWPGLKHLELVKIEYKLNVVPGWRTHWDTEMNPKDKAPSFPIKTLGLMEVRAKLREPGWSAQGWAKDSPGYVLYYNQVRKVPRVLYGTNIIREFEKDREYEAKKVGWNNFHVPPSPKCVQVHMISHRYATTKEKWKDKISYHSFALLEWDHGKYCTVIELAFLNGLGGYNARCNHTEDRDEPVTGLLKCFPPEMVKPWKDTLSELRCIDVKAKNLSEHLEFMARHTGKDKYFLDVRHTFSHAVRLTFCSQEQIVQYLINYIRRGRTYSEIRKNCQTFCADFCAFLAGKKDVQPFHPLNRFEYRNQTHYFMYESTMYS